MLQGNQGHVPALCADPSEAHDWVDEMNDDDETRALPAIGDNNVLFRGVRIHTSDLVGRHPHTLKQAAIAWKDVTHLDEVKLFTIMLRNKDQPMVTRSMLRPVTVLNIRGGGVVTIDLPFADVLPLFIAYLERCT